MIPCFPNMMVVFPIYRGGRDREEARQRKS